MDSVTSFFTGVIVGSVFLAVMLVCEGESPHQVRQEAVKAGVAEWTVSAEGVRGFRWLPAKQPEPAR